MANPTIQRCPNCGASAATAKEAAAHACPTEVSSAQGRDPTPEEVVTAYEETRRRAQVRAAIKPTSTKLLGDARKLVQAVVDGWDGEVEVIVALVPKGSNGITTVRYIFGEGGGKERARYILRKLLDRLNDTEAKMPNPASGTPN